MFRRTSPFWLSIISYNNPVFKYYFNLVKCYSKIIEDLIFKVFIIIYEDICIKSYSKMCLLYLFRQMSREGLAGEKWKEVRFFFSPPLHVILVRRPTCKTTVPGPLSHPAGKATVPGTLGQRILILLLIVVFLIEKFYQAWSQFNFVLTRSSSSCGLSETIKPKSVKKTRKYVARRTLFIAQCSLLSETWAQFLSTSPDQTRFFYQKGIKDWSIEEPS